MADTISDLRKTGAKILATLDKEIATKEKVLAELKAEATSWQQALLITYENIREMEGGIGDI